jgi:hypothetical protein
MLARNRQQSASFFLPEPKLTPLPPLAHTLVRGWEAVRHFKKIS